MSGEITFVFSPQHPAFPGHFPQTPIVPGALLLDETIRAIEAANHSSMHSGAIAWAKFRGTAGPGEPLTLRFEQRPDRSIKFEIRTPFGVVAEGVMEFTLCAADPIDES